MPPSVLTGRVVLPGQPLWTKEDTDLAVALTEIEADRCGGCGQPRSESMDPANEYAYRADPLRCFSCAARERESRSRGENWDEAGISWVTVKG